MIYTRGRLKEWVLKVKKLIDLKITLHCHVFGCFPTDICQLCYDDRYTWTIRFETNYAVWYLYFYSELKGCKKTRTLWSCFYEVLYQFWLNCVCGWDMLVCFISVASVQEGDNHTSVISSKTTLNISACSDVEESVLLKHCMVNNTGFIQVTITFIQLAYRFQHFHSIWLSKGNDCKEVL